MSETSPKAAGSANSPKATPAGEQPASYEAGMRELERLLAEMESGQLPLDGLLESYQRGADLLKFCRSKLEAVEVQVKVLEDGIAKPWNPPN